MVLGKLPVPGRPTIWITVGQGPIALAVGAGGGCLDIFTLIYRFSPLSPSLWETARYRLKYCLKGPLNPKQPTNQSSWYISSVVAKGIRKFLPYGFDTATRHYRTVSSTKTPMPPQHKTSKRCMAKSSILVDILLKIVIYSQHSLIQDNKFEKS